MNRNIISIVLLIILSLNIVSAGVVSANKIIIVNNNFNKVEESISKENIFIFFGNYYEGKIPNSYKYISVNYKGVEKNSKLEQSLQKLIYLDLINNSSYFLKKNEPLKAWAFYKVAEKVLNINLDNINFNTDLKNRYTNINDLKVIINIISNKNLKIDDLVTSKDIEQKVNIFKDIYKTILSGHYYKDSLDEGKIIDSAIEGLTKGTNDVHTVYYPPIESKNFFDSLDGDYEGIGSYVDMTKPGVLKIVSPIPGSPSEKAGLKGGDLVIKVDGKIITEDNSLSEVITWIKGPALSKVVLTIDRKGKIFDIIVIRDRIILNDINTELINSTTYYLQIKSFGNNVSRDFKKSIDEINKNKNIKKIIIDLRNNGGGYLTEVTEILSYFIEEGKQTAIVKYNDYDKTYISRGYDEIDFSKYNIVLLQNSGTASASEILIGTLQDYYPNIKSIGEKSYGKGSVQVMKTYIDGSLLKYTIAKWFTGLTETGIDQIGIEPTIKLEFDLDSYQKKGFDNQLNKAIHIR